MSEMIKTSPIKPTERNIVPVAAVPSEIVRLQAEVNYLQGILDEIEAKRAAGREKKRVYMREKMRGYRAADKAKNQQGE
jgi:hypothetical protein